VSALTIPTTQNSAAIPTMRNLDDLDPTCGMHDPLSSHLGCDERGEILERPARVREGALPPEPLHE
jgi:hypothetical protein